MSGPERKISVSLEGRMDSLSSTLQRAETETARHTQAMASSFGKVDAGILSVGRSLGTLAVGTLAMGASAAGVGLLGKDAVLAAARYETLGTVVQVVGEHTAYTSSQMAAFQLDLQKTGISAIESRQGLAFMGEAQIDFANSSKLARIAQDAAVVGNINSSEAFNRMVTGLATGQTILLHHLGLMTNFETAYIKAAHAQGKTTNDLTEHEKVQIRVNEVIRAGVGIAGSYEAAMGTVGKQLTSLPRYVQDLKVKFGELGQGALFTGVSAVTSTLKSLTANFDSVASGIQGVVTSGAILFFGGLTSKLVDFAASSAMASQHSQALRMNTIYNAEATAASTAATSAAAAEELLRAEAMQAGIISERSAAAAKIQTVAANNALIASQVAVAETEAAAAIGRTARITAHLEQIAVEVAALQAKGTLTKTEAAFANELRNEEWVSRNRLVVAMAEQGVAETNLSALQVAATKSAQAQTAAITEMAVVAKSAATAEVQLAAATAGATTAATAHSAATSVQAVALTEASLAGRVMTGVAGGLSTTLALVGGPVGAIAIAIAGLTYEIVKFLEKAEVAQGNLARLQNQGQFAQMSQQLREIESLNRKMEQANKPPAEVAKDNTLAIQKAINTAIKDNVDLLRQKADLEKKSGKTTAVDTWLGNVTEWDKLNTKINDNNNLIAHGATVNKEMNAALAKQAALKKAKIEEPPPKADKKAESLAQSWKREIVNIKAITAEAAEGFSPWDKAIEEANRKADLLLLKYGKVAGAKEAIEGMRSSLIAKPAADVERQMYESDVIGGEANLNERGQMSDSQQAAFDKSADESKWKASRVAEDSAEDDRITQRMLAEMTSKATMAEYEKGYLAELASLRGDSSAIEMLRIQQQEDEQIRSWAMMTDSFEVHQQRMDIIEGISAEKRIQLQKNVAVARLRLTADMFGSMAGLIDGFSDLSRSKNRTAFRVYQQLKLGENEINTGAAITQALTDKDSSSWYERAAKAVIAGAIGTANSIRIMKASPDGGSGGGGASMNYSAGGGYSNPAVTQPMYQTQQQGNVTISVNMDNVYGDQDQLKKWAEEQLRPVMLDAQTRNVNFIVTDK